MKNGLILILNYHGISEQTGKDKYIITRDNFERQLGFIRDSGIPVLSSVCSNNPADFSIVITIDDGNRSDTEIVVPFLKKFGYSATFFPHTSVVGEPGKVNWIDLQSIADQGFKLGSHGVSHVALPLCNPMQLRDELKLSKELLEYKTGVDITDIALPYGAYNANVIEMARRIGYTNIYSTGLKINNGREAILSRWNITTDISEDKFRSVLSSAGKLPFNTKLSAFLKHCSKRLMGSALIHSRSKN